VCAERCPPEMRVSVPASEKAAARKDELGFRKVPEADPQIPKINLIGA